jgi:hypothetical protein
MEASIETELSPEAIWKAWERAHALHTDGALEEGQRAKRTGFKYKILHVVPGVRFSILWKSLFVRMVFTHVVQPSKKGALIRYSAEIKGLFSWPLRFLLRSKIQNNLSFSLKEFVKIVSKSTLEH